MLAVGCGSAFSASSGDTGSDASTGDGPVGTEGGGSDAAPDGACTPKTCPQQSFACGPASDGCGKAIDCGTCPGATDVCDVTHQCKCVTLTCKDVGAQCGSIADGCGGTLNCGTCPTGETCGGGGALQCGTGTCVPATCATKNVQCGPIDDGCGNVVQCPDTCVAPETCGGSGNANQCGCTAKTCTTLGWQCGSGDNGCGGTIDCGGCDGGACNQSAHSCTCTPAQTCASLGYQCGQFTDSCGAVEVCGPVPVKAPVSSECSGTTLPVFYSCCTNGIVSGITPPAGGSPNIDAGACGLSGPNPPEPGWDCTASNGTAGAGWCCAQ